MIFLVFVLCLFCETEATDFNYRDSSKVTVSSPKLIELGKPGRTSLDNYKVVDLSADVTVGSSCGEMNISKNLRANLDELLGDDFFKGMGNKIQDAGGMLALCYLSPSYCAIAKHMRLSSHFLSQLNLDSCSMIDKYVDSRVSDYEMSKQQCVRQTMQSNGQDVKAALEKCGNGRAAELSDWSGMNKGETDSNALIGSSAKWAGLKDAEAMRVVDLTKALVGDTVLAKGGLQVEFGDRRKLTSPRQLISEESEALERKFGQFMSEMQAGGELGKDRQRELAEIFGNTVPLDVGHQVIRKLSFMPYRQRELVIRRLSKAISRQKVVEDAEKSMEVLALAGRNPNLPPHRQAEALALKAQLKQSLDLTLEMRESESDNLTQVLSAIDAEGGKFEAGVSRRNLEGDASRLNKERVHKLFFDCSDQTFCSEGS